MPHKSLRICEACRLVIWMTPAHPMRPAFLIRLMLFGRNRYIKTGGITLTRKLRRLWRFQMLLGGSSHPKLPFKTLYLGSNSITCFWESGLGRNLIKRFSTDRTIPEDDLIARIEYTVSLDSTGLRLFNANDSAARRSIGAHSIACFQADHVVSRQWASGLFSAGAHGILYSSARSDGTCLALFKSAATCGALGSPRRVRCCYDDAPLLASLFREGVRLL